MNTQKGFLTNIFFKQSYKSSLTNSLHNILLTVLTLCLLIQPPLAMGNNAPTFITRPISYAKLDVPYTYQAEARDAEYDNLIYTAPTLPAWLTFEHIKTNQVMVTTFAGSESGFVDGVGTTAQFASPFGLAVDKNDNIYVADAANNRIRKITPAGIVTTLEAELDKPNDVAIDKAGNIYALERDNHRIRKIALDGTLTTLAGNGSPGNADGIGTSAQFNSPSAIAVDSENNVYVADTDNHRIRKITPAGKVTTLAGNKQDYAEGIGTTASFNSPRGVTVDTNNNVYVTDSKNYRIRKITPEGLVTTLAGRTDGLADGEGLNAQFSFNEKIAVDHTGNLYVTDTLNQSIRLITPLGKVITLAGDGNVGTKDGLGTEALFYQPLGIVIDSKGHVYVSETSLLIRKLTPIFLPKLSGTSDTVGQYPVVLQANDGKITVNQQFIIKVDKTAKVSSSEELYSAIDMANSNGVHNTIVFTNDIILTEPLPLIESDITFTGNNYSISGNNTYRLFFIKSGKVKFSNLTLKEALAQGGNGVYGSGGGAGMGSAIFVNESGFVSIDTVIFQNNHAIGGNGGGSQEGNGGGGGGMGGHGGSPGLNDQADSQIHYGGGGGGGGLMLSGENGSDADASAETGGNGGKGGDNPTDNADKGLSKHCLPGGDCIILIPVEGGIGLWGAGGGGGGGGNETIMPTAQGPSNNSNNNEGSSPSDNRTRQSGPPSNSQDSSGQTGSPPSDSDNQTGSPSSDSEASSDQTNGSPSDSEDSGGQSSGPLSHTSGEGGDGGFGGGGGGSTNNNGGAGGFGGGGGSSGNRETKGGKGGFGGGGGGAAYYSNGANGGTYGGYGAGVGGGGGAGLGGAIFVRQFGQLILSNSHFESNAAIGGKSPTGSDDAKGQGKGGAIFVQAGATVDVDGTLTFTNNNASDAGTTNQDNANVYGILTPIVTLSATGTPGEAFTTTATFTISKATSYEEHTVNFTVGQSDSAATWEQDYILSGAENFDGQDGVVIVPAGQRPSVTLTITPIDDTISDPNETIQLILSDGIGYELDANNAATLTIEDNDFEKVYTGLFLETSSATILNNDPLDIVGKLNRYPDTGEDLSNLSIMLTITAPDGTTRTETGTTHTDTGQFKFEQLSGFTLEGAYGFKVVFVGTNRLAESESSSETVLVGASAGYVILVQGKIQNGEGLAAHNKTIHRIYKKLKERGLEDDNIKYLNYNPTQEGVDGLPIKADIQAAFVEMQSRINSNPAPFSLIMIDHGGIEGNFHIYNGNNDANDLIVPADIANWLDNLEMGLTPNALQKPRIIIIGACYSGSFIPALSKPGRIIISSATAQEESYKGPDEPDGIRSGEFFMEELFSQLSKGDNLKTAFEVATERTETFTRSGDNSANASINRFHDDANQHPLLDDNGDGKGSNFLSTNGDGQVASSLSLGAGLNYDTNFAGNPAEIVSVIDTIYLSADEVAATLMAKVNQASRVTSAPVDIRKPSVFLSDDGTENSEQLEITNLPRVFMNCSNATQNCVSYFDEFTEPGKYEAFYFVRDNETLDISPIKRSVIYKDYAGNTPPTAFELNAPVNGSTHKTTLLFDWQTATDADGSVTYNFYLSTAENFSTAIYQQEELITAMTYVDEAVALEDQTTYYWKVEAVDPFGARTTSTSVFSLTTNNTNAPPSIGSLYISSALDFTAVDDAEVVFLDEFGNPLPDYDFDSYEDEGYYNLLLPTGRRRAVVQVEGFETQEIELDTSQGLATLQVEMTPVGGIPNHPGQLQFSASDSFIRENQGMVTLLVERVTGQSGTVSINYTLREGNATLGSDYTFCAAPDSSRNVAAEKTCGTGTLIWTDQEELSKKIPLFLIDDPTEEANETLTLTLSNPTGGVALGTSSIIVTIVDDESNPESLPSDNSDQDSDQTTVTIPNTTPGTLSPTIVVVTEPVVIEKPVLLPEPPTLQFMTNFYVTHEKIGALTTFTVTRHGNSQGKVSVQYKIANGSTAKLNQDYTGGSGTLIWTAGDNTPKPIHLTLLDDEDIEGPEIIELSLFNPIGSIKLGEYHQAILGITDDESPIPQTFPQKSEQEKEQEKEEESNTIQFSADTYSTIESDGNVVTLRVNRTGDGTGEVSVQYMATAEGTTAAHNDYTGKKSGILTWIDEDKEPKAITLTLMDDEESEGTETVHFMLFNVTGNVELGLAEAQLVISDDDMVFLPSLGQGIVILPETATCVSQTAEIANLSEETGECKVNTFFRGGASLNGEDYQSTLTLLPSQRINIVGQIDVDTTHVGQKADILIVVGLLSEDSQILDSWLMFDEKGQTLAWDGKLASLVAAYENVSLAEKQSVEILQGLLGEGNLALFFGYYLQESGLIVFNGEQGIQVRINQDNQAVPKPLKIWPIVQEQQIITASSDGKIRLWDSNSGHRLAYFSLPIMDVEYATFSPNGKVLATAFNDTISLWEVNDGTPLIELIGHEDAVKQISFSADGQQIATTSWDNTTRLWEIETGEELLTLKHQAIVEHAAFSPDGKQVITTSWDKTARLWEVKTGQEVLTLTGHRNGVSHATFSPKGEYIVTTSWDNKVRLWDAKTGEVVWVREHQAGVNHAAFSPDGQIIVTGSNDGTARLWETATGEPIKTLKGHKGNVWHVGFSPDGKRVTSASWDNTVRVWDVETGELLTVLKD
jgi:WD40 repeat protein